jgi:hypothetical protein
MQSRISDRAAVAFAKGFFAGFARTGTAEIAMAEGRQAIVTDSEINAEWGVPCLFARDGQLTRRVTWTWATPLLAASLAGAMALGIKALWPPCVSITDPGNHSKVGPVETVAGKYCGTANGQDIWVVVFSEHDRRFFPHRFKAEKLADRTWKSRDVPIGAAGDAGKTFEIIPLLASRDASDQLTKYGNSLESAGMEQLPKMGVTEYEQHKVTRK